MKKKIIIGVLCLFISFPAFAQVDPNLSKTPPMGWNSWNWFGKDNINEKIVRETIDAIVKEGLLEAGYNYVVVDGGWRDIKLDPSGKLLPHPVKFPDGIKPLVDYAHSNGLKFGLHTVPGTHDCGLDPIGGFGLEEIHVRQFLEWGIDFIKLDRCVLFLNEDEEVDRNNQDWTEELIFETYAKWSKLLYESDRDILFSISAYEYYDWYPTYSNMARTTYDIRAKVSGGAIFHLDDPEITNHLAVIRIAEENNESAEYAGNGYWNDPDMLVTGEQGLTLNEQKVHFALWSIMSAPLMLGNDVRNMSQGEKDIILNKEVISINQDPTEQGKLLAKNNDSQIWAKNLKDGSVAILLINLNPNNEKEISINFSDVDLSGKIHARDLFNHKNLGEFETSISLMIEPNDGSMLLLIP